MTASRARTLVLGAATVLALGTALTGCGSQTSTTSAPGTGSTATTQAAAGSGALTVGVTEGPYYITNTKELTGGALNYTNLPGDPIKVSGFVYGGVGNATPLAGAKIEIWQADNGGQYHPNTNGDAANFAAGELALRGYVVSDATGHYSFTTIYPGLYPGRCRHIHVRASATGYGGIVSQLIVPAKQGDSQTPETDQIAQSLPAVNHMRFTAAGGVQETTFDFHLAAD